jgi:transglutaminase-like putative cysteine protease
MPSLIEVTHITTYRYARAVAFGEHRVMFRPRPGHDMRVLQAQLTVEPADAQIRYVTDAFSNSIALVTLPTPAAALVFTARFAIEHFGSPNLELPISEDAALFPLAYSADERLDLHPFLQPWATDERGELAAWAQTFVTATGGHTRATLRTMMEAIRNGFTYRARAEEGTQHPLDTIRLRGGTCRDYAHLMIEACRRLGVAARFVSGYLYDPAVDGAEVGMVGAGSTHAWAELYLPGAGWVAYDPTNLLYGGESLIRVAVTRTPVQAVPLAGTFIGEAADDLGMTIDVQARKLAAVPDFLSDGTLAKAATWLANRLNKRLARRR